MLGELPLCDESRRAPIDPIDNEALKAAIEQDSVQTCGEPVERFQVSDESLHRIVGLLYVRILCRQSVF